MPAKPHAKNWKDVQMVISAVAVTFTLGLWNLVASPKKSSVGGQSSQANLQPQTTSFAAITPALPLLPGQVLLLNGDVPATSALATQTSTTSQQAASPVHHSGGGGGGGTVTKTRSSHP